MSLDEIQEHREGVIRHDIQVVLRHKDKLTQAGLTIGDAPYSSPDDLGVDTPTPLLCVARSLMYAATEPTHMDSRGRQAKEALGELVLPNMRLRPAQAVTRLALCSDYNTTCSIAERAFLDAVLQATTSPRDIVEAPEYHHKILSVYQDHDGLPILLRKRRIEGSALTLVPLEWDGLTLPAGSIVSVDTKKTRLIARKRRRDDSLRVYEFSGAPTVRPLRLSAWVFDDELDRALFARKAVAPGWYAEDANLLRGTTIESFQAAADRIVDRTGANKRRKKYYARVKRTLDFR